MLPIKEKKLTKLYLEASNKQLETAKQWQQPLCDVYRMLVSEMYYAEFEHEYNGISFQEYINREGITRVEQFLEGALGEVVSRLLEEPYLDIFRQIVVLLPRLPYKQDWCRRSIRSSDAGLYAERFITELEHLLVIQASTCSIDQWIECSLGKAEDGWRYTDCPILALALRLKDGHPQTLDLMKRALSGKDNTLELYFMHFRAVAMSGRKELLEAETRLLLAARLQDGLRQGIMETADEGVPESFIHMVNVVIEHDLIRFSSVKRSLMVTTGMNVDNLKLDKQSDQVLTFIHRFVNDTAAAEATIASTDSTVELYIALWGLAFYDVERIRPHALRLIKEGKPHQVQALFVFLSSLDHVGITLPYVLEAVHRWNNRPEVMATIKLCMEDLTIHQLAESMEKIKTHVDLERVAEDFFDTLCETLPYVSKPLKYEAFVFPWMSGKIAKADIYAVLGFIVAAVNNTALTDRFCTMLPEVDSDTRAAFTQKVLCHAETPIQREMLFNALGDKSEWVRNKAWKAMADREIDDETIRVIEGHLRLKYNDLRVTAVQILLKLDDERLAESISRLLADRVADRRLAALDILKLLSEKSSRKAYVEQFRDEALAVKRPTEAERKLTNVIFPKENGEQEVMLSDKNGWGLYNPNSKFTLTPPEPDPDFKIEEAFEFLVSGKAIDVVKELQKLIDKHKDTTFDSEFHERMVLGSAYPQYIDSESYEKAPLGEVWKAFYQEHIRDSRRMEQLYILSRLNDDILKDFDNLIARVYAFSDGKGFPDLRTLQKQYAKVEKYKVTFGIIKLMWNVEVDVLIHLEYSRNIMARVCKEYNGEPKTITHKGTWIDSTYALLEDERLNWATDALYKVRPKQHPEHAEAIEPLFRAFYHLFLLADYNRKETKYLKSVHHIPIPILAYAVQKGLLPVEEAYRYILTLPCGLGQIGNLCKLAYHIEKSYKHLREQAAGLELDTKILCNMVDRLTDRLIGSELQRGDTPTHITDYARELTCIQGIDRFITLAEGLKKAPLTLGYGDKCSNVLSKLIHETVPTANDTATLLKKKAKEAGISGKRLVEIGMFAPQWIDLIEEALGWKGLASAVYFFLAHTVSYWSDTQEEARIARYTPLTNGELDMGAVDIDWFKEMYQTIGKKHFEMVYKNAGLISRNNMHSRVRKFVDAMSGQYKVTDIRKEVETKRSKDFLLCLGLIPLGKDREKDLLERYQYIRQFLKESKEYGAQRQESEKKAVDMTLLNLARTAGFEDSTRLTWVLETEMMKELHPFFEPKLIDDTSIYIHIDEDGKAAICQEKNGKALKSLPAKLKKNKYVLELKAVNQALKEQYGRARKLFEESMEEETAFRVADLARLMEHPVLEPLLRNLVFITEQADGFFRTEEKNDNTAIIVNANEETQVLQAEEILRIAHPYHLFERKIWSDYQKVLFEKRIRQPFKQVFRELYVATEEEREIDTSRRYAGNQILPKKAAAILKTRHWQVDYEEGLQKVYYKHNLVATIYAMADWFSPSDIEAPALEYVSFHARTGHESVKIGDISAVVFSEIMRDVDLAVSVAHAGGVDPETSHSTIELRTALAEHTARLLHLDNVRIDSRFAFVKGKRATYHIHLGSGEIHQEGGTHIAVLPVHSQHHGRLFLPFMDDDPKTAEILSKIILFAEDDRIKDPMILSQIK